MENQCESIRIISKPYSNEYVNDFVEIIEFCNFVSLQYFIDHLKRNNCEDFDIEKLEKILIFEKKKHEDVKLLYNEAK